MIFNRGFSFIESLIAMAILVTTGLSTLTFYRYLEIERANLSLLLQASMLAKSAISQLQQVNTNFICASGNTISFENIEDYTIPTINSPFRLRIETNKSLVFSSPSGHDVNFVKMIKVFVNWQDRRGQSQELILPTSVSIFSNLL